jgi:beta-glucosidase
VVQVYLSDRTGHIARPRRELAGFAKVSLKPGENKMVKVPIPKAVFGFWDEDTASWQVPSGHYELEIARNSQEVVASIPITVTGTVGSEQGAGNASDYWQQLGAAALATAASGSGLRRGSGKVSGETRGYTRDSTVTELEQTFVGRRIAAMIRKGALPEEDSELSRYMVERQVAELPIRTGAMFSGGRLTLGMVDAILAMANGKAHKVFPTALRTRLRG